MNIGFVLEAAATANPEQRAISVGDQLIWRYGGFYRCVSSLASGMVSRYRLQQGDRVAIVMPNCAEYLVILHACWHAGLCAVPVNSRLHAAEMRYAIEHSGAKVCFSGNSSLEDVAKAAGDLEGIVVVDVHAAEYRALTQCDPIPVAEVDESEPCWLFYTSGTTGRPKGAMLTHRALMEMVWRYYADLDAIDHQDTTIHTASLSHGCGLFSLPFTAKGAHHVIPSGKSFDEQEVFDLINSHRKVSFFAAPTMIRRLIDHSACRSAHIDSIRSIVLGSAPIAPEDIRRALQTFGPRINHVYGQGEMPVTITCVTKRHFAESPQPTERLLSTVGPARTGVRLAIVDGNGKRLEPGEVGEVTASSSVMMAGYWRDPEASAAAIRNGWLFTGDVGLVDADGWLTLRGRSKDMIISGGYNIYAAEIELVLGQHPKIAQAAVIGVPHPEWGEEVVAFVVKRDAQLELLSDELDAWCKMHVARFKRPRRYIVKTALPTNTSGKIVKASLRAEAEVGTAVRD